MASRALRSAAAVRAVVDGATPSLFTASAAASLRVVGILMEVFAVIEETALEVGVAKQLVLVAAWLRPLHVVVIVDEARQEDRILTIYEPYPEAWSSDYRRRR